MFNRTANGCAGTVRVYWAVRNMKALSKCDSRQILSVILASDRLREKFEDSIMDSEMDWLSDKINCFPRGAIDYSFGLASPCYFSIQDDWGCLEGIRESVRNFGSSERLEKLLEWSEKLYGSNLFSWSVKKVADLYFDEEFMRVIKYMEDVGYKIYCKDEDAPELIDYVENGYVDSVIDGVYLNGQGKPVRMETL